MLTVPFIEAARSQATSIKSASSRDMTLLYWRSCQICASVPFEDSEEINCRPSQFPLPGKFLIYISLQLLQAEEVII